jgi:hypothetical protein
MGIFEALLFSGAALDPVKNYREGWNDGRLWRRLKAARLCIRQAQAVS